MPVVEHDDLIEHLATDTPDEPLAVGIVPRTARGDHDFFDAHVLDPVLEGNTIDRLPIPQERAWRGHPGKRLNDVLSGPLRRGMFRNIEMHDAPTLVSQKDAHEQDLETGSRHGQEVTRHEVRDVMLEEGLPRG